MSRESATSATETRKKPRDNFDDEHRDVQNQDNPERRGLALSELLQSTSFIVAAIIHETIPDQPALDVVTSRHACPAPLGYLPGN